MRPPIEGSEDRYPTGSEYYDMYIEGREAMMEGDDIDDDNPYRHQPHDVMKCAAWRAGWLDEDMWRLDSTGR